MSSPALLHMTYVDLNSSVPNAQSHIVPRRENGRTGECYRGNGTRINSFSEKRNKKEVQTSYCKLKIKKRR